MKVDAAVFWYKRALMGNKESSLPGLIPYTSKHSRGKTFAVHQQCALCRENFRGLQS